MLRFDHNPHATPIELVSTDELDAWRTTQDASTLAWADRTGFEAKANEHFVVPGADGAPGRVIAGIGERATIESIGGLPAALAPGAYRLEAVEPSDQYALTLGWGLGAYQFDRYKSSPKEPVTLHVGNYDPAVQAEVEAVALCRDLINAPTSDMLPHDLEAAARKLAITHGADIEVTTGNELLEKRLNVIHAVGRASASAPRLIDVSWGNPDDPRITLVGKGVCFDSGGLDIKSASNMRMMKKDMGGGATALGLADLVMTRALPVRLRVLVPAVENAISSNAFRPGDVLHSYKGTTIEIDNTDAEGRLILCDALALAAEDDPQLIVDFATLTGAARAALGTELPAMFANDDDVANGIIAAGLAVDDPVWRMPLHAPYRSLLDSKIADIANAASIPQGGAITAALFLEQFVAETPWVHFDVMAWNQRARPAHPEGGEAMGLRAVFEYLQARYSPA